MKYETYRKVNIKLFRWYYKIYHRLKVIGLENIPNGPALIVPNHSAGYDLDNPAISYCAHPTREIYVMDWEKYHYMNSMWGRYFLVGGIPLWLRGGIRWKYINPYLHKNGSKYPSLVCMFPEGTSGEFQHRHVLWRFYSGVVQIALKYKVPIVPTAMVNFQKACPILKSWEQESGPADPILYSPITYPFKLKVEFGKPFELDKFYDKKLSKAEQLWVANRIIRPKVAKVLMKHTEVKLESPDFEMKKPNFI